MNIRLVELNIYRTEMNWTEMHWKYIELNIRGSEVKWEKVNLTF